MQVKLKHDYRNKLNSRIIYNLNEKRLSNKILTEQDIINIRKRNAITDINHANRYWENLSDGISENLEFK